MSRFVSLFTVILMACTGYTVGSNLYGAPNYSPIASIISGRNGLGSAIIHPNSAVSLPAISRSIPYIGQQQYISAPLAHQSYSSPLVSGGLYGQNIVHGNSYALQRGYPLPLARSAHGLYTTPIVTSAYGAPFGQAHGVINGYEW